MILMIASIISMLALGWVVWMTLQRQESADEEFQEKLSRDDERAQRGRAGLPPEQSDEDQRSGSA